MLTEVTGNVTISENQQLESLGTAFDGLEESAQARERVAEFWGAFYQGTPEDLHMLLTDQWGARYLLVDRFVMGELHASRYLAGLGRDVALPDGSAAALLLEPGKLPPSGFQVLEEGEWFVLYRLATP